MRRATYAASLDPITFGHLNIIERMAPHYDELIVMVAVDPRKNYTFPSKQRVRMAMVATAHIPNVKVVACIHEYVVKLSEKMEADVLIRGVRNISDLEAELPLATENRAVSQKVETIWVPCLPELAHVSSSLVKSHIGVAIGWEEQVARHTPEAVVKELRKNHAVSFVTAKWHEVMRRLGNPQGHEDYLKELIHCYQEKGRSYHNLEHIASMLGEFEEVAHLAEDPDAVRLGTGYHDAIYDPRKKNNEEMSADLGRVHLSNLNIDPSFVRKICGRPVESGLVMATKHAVLPGTIDERIIVDLDLAILGRGEKEFDAYEAAIREEYSFVSESDFRVGRTEILKGFLDRTSIYSTSYFLEKYEEQARKNLARSIVKLQG